jgi:hypothetical protein
MRRTRRVMGCSLVAAAALGCVAATSAAGAPTTKVSVVVSGLSNPRGLTWAHGQLYLAEAGKAGADCPPGAKGPTGGQLCFGRTGSLDVISGGSVHRIRSGLISNSDVPGGVAAEGIEAVTGTARGVQVVYGESVLANLYGLPPGTHLTPADSAAARHELGMLDSVIGTRERNLADVGDSDLAWSGVHQDLVPDQFPDANPNALLQLGDVTYVIDAGSNVLSSVDSRGLVRQLAFFSNPAHSDAVPTCIAKGRDNALYVGQLAPGAALNQGRIYRYSLSTGRLTVWKSGFNVVDGCGFDHAGNFYAVEFQAHGFNPSPTGNPAGDIIKISPNGKRSVIGAGSLFFPQGFAVDPKGNVYVSNWSIMTGTPSGPGGPTGEVVKIRP